MRTILWAAPIALAVAIPSSAALIFQFNAAPGMPQEAIDGFAAAGARWSALFSDNVTVVINVDFTALGPGILGQASSTSLGFSYGAVRNALLADRTSADDYTATANLQPGDALIGVLNRTADNPNGAGSATPYLDNDGGRNNRTVFLTQANAKALGLAVGPTVDASIAFSSAFTWDFNPLDGITAGAFDFVGVATHEIGHALGFVSAVDLLDCFDGPGPGPCTFGGNPGPFTEDDFGGPNILDLYRYSSLSVSLGALDWSADAREKYFSIDGGVTNLALFATGLFNGDGRQASHWKDNLGIGIMDPTAAGGELLVISARDIQAFDVIGWDRTEATIPEPSTLALSAAGLAVACARRRRAA